MLTRFKQFLASRESSSICSSKIYERIRRRRLEWLKKVLFFWENVLIFFPNWKLGVFSHSKSFAPGGSQKVPEVETEGS